MDKVKEFVQNLPDTVIDVAKKVDLEDKRVLIGATIAATFLTTTVVSKVASALRKEKPQYVPVVRHFAPSQCGKNERINTKKNARIHHHHS